MLEDRAKNVVYLPVARELLDELSSWSGPVQIRFVKPRFDADPQLEVRQLARDVVSQIELRP